MVSFASLPSEILLLIAKCLGSSWLRANGPKLALCKAWYRIAQYLAIEKISCSVQTLQRFLGASERAHYLVLTNVRELSIESRNFTPHKSLLDNAGLVARRALEPSEIRTIRNSVNEGWEPEEGQLRARLICGSLISLAGYLPHMANLQKLRLKISMRAPEHDWTYEERPDLLSNALGVIASCLPFSIVSLTIDMPSDPLFPRDDHFLCSKALSVNGMIDGRRNLRHLHVRLRRICPRIFDHLRDHPALETLIINISVEDGGSECLYGRQLRCCVKDSDASASLNVDMFEAARQVASTLTALRVFRIVHDIEGSLQFASYDVLKNDFIRRWGEVDWTRDHLTNYYVEERQV